MRPEEKDQQNEHTLGETIQSWLDEAKSRINDEFPLSGGETEKDLEGWDDIDVSHEHLNDNFPLSGG